MTILTIISVVLAVLVVITGFFGMNVPLPWINNKHAWVTIIVICIVLWFLIVALLRYMIYRIRHL